MNGRFKIAILAALAVTACKQAGYEVLAPGLQEADNFQAQTSIPPTAAIEVLDQGIPVTWTYVDTKVVVKPTADTLDADYIEKSKCENPGIIQASYDLANGTKPVVDRQNCDSLATKDVSYSQPGDYLIQLQVKSEDNEIAWASMTLKVVAKGTPRDQIEGGFTIHTKPILASVNQKIDFTGICELKGQLNISWDFADNTQGEGATSQHAYAAKGQYRVTAVCKNANGKALQASLTVVVIDGPAPTVPDVAIVTPSKNPNIPAATPTPGCNPTQGPCQTGAQVPNKTATTTQVPKKTTTPSTPIYYDPYCSCYYYYN